MRSKSSMASSIAITYMAKFGGWRSSYLAAETGEVYRIIADRQGVFVQPALFEAFGLTVIEAMITGLPTFATQFGGSIEDNSRSSKWFLYQSI
jgi:glycosyltransferase involved in cell wall biosynthesis